MIASALIRVWGSAYLGREVVHDHALHSEALRADGPYRHTRNPLYFGNALMAVGHGNVRARPSDSQLSPSEFRCSVIG
jgi:protein-S-isoprenylcysteine O-methyltransferase Ste14